MLHEPRGAPHTPLADSPIKNFLFKLDFENHSAAMVSLDNKQNMNMEHRDQYYASARKPLQSPCRDINALERIPGTHTHTVV